MQSGEVAVALEEFARAHAFKFIPKTVSHWQMYVGKQLVNVYFGRKGFSLYVDSSSPAGAYRSYSISEIFEQIESVHRAALAVTVTNPVRTTELGPRPGARLSSSKQVGGLRCRVTTTWPAADSCRPSLTSIALISDGDPCVAVHLDDADTEDVITVQDAANVVLTVASGEPAKQLLRLLRFAAHTLEEMMERNERVASSVG